VSRFHESQHPDFQRLNASIGFDRRLWPQDVASSRAHARMLADRGVLTAEDLSALLAGLDAVEQELREGRFGFSDADEDIHMAIERRLTELAGPVGGRLHTARSRNDQVVTDLAMYTRERAHAGQAAITGLMDALLVRAQEHADWPMPGYTHLQRAQPVYLGHHLLAYFWMLARDRERFAFTERQAAVLPLGAGALAGVNFDTDRGQVARELGFASVSPNSIDAVSGRDFILDYLSAAATCATHLSRLGAELVLWSSSEFGFCELPDSWSSGSSIMPQKKNPDAAELLRAKAPRVVGHLAAFHGVMHALVLTYNKDLQEDKEHLFDAVDTLELTLAAATGMIAAVSFRRERLLDAASDELIAATDIADLLVRLGVPFREAHGVVAGLVRTALDGGKRLSELSADELSAHSELLGTHQQEFSDVLAQSSWLESKVSEGGTSLARVEEQLARARTVLDEGTSS
jgi:argininosuccinate lyase